MRGLTLRSAAVIAAVAAGLACRDRAATRTPAAGDAPQAAGVADLGMIAPDFSVVDLSGHTLNLASYRGKVVLLDFWATWCVPCREEIPHFVRLQDKYRDAGLAVIGISVDDEVAPVREYYRTLRMNYPVAMGDAALAERYGGILGVPVAFMIDRQGRIRMKHAGQTDAAVFERDVTELLGSR